MPNISIVIPVYNSEQYIFQCIESVIKQRFKDFEIILVNDGSNDNSLIICKQWSKTDPRIKIIDKENGGVSSARNAGLKEAKGDWIIFIDSDDWINFEYLSTLINALDHYSIYVDWVTSGITYHYANGSVKKEVPKKLGLYITESHNGLLTITSQTLVTSPVGKLYRTSIIKNNKLFFDPRLSFGEDRDFNLRYISYCKNCLITSYNGYNYRKDISSSLSTRIRGNIFEGDLTYWGNLYKLFQERDFLTLNVRKYLITRLYNFIIDYISYRSLSRKEVSFIKKNVDWKFLKENLALLSSNKIIRILFQQKYIHTLNFILTLRRWL